MGREANTPARWWGDDFLDALNDWNAARHASEPAITIIDAELAAKGGTPGKPDPGGSDGGGSSGGGGGVLSQYWSGEGNGYDGYDILIDFKGQGWTSDLQNVFIQAADYLTDVITGDIGGDTRYHGTYVDDLYVTAKLSTIDGAGGILGQAGPTAVWTANDLTAAGTIEFDVADAQNFFNAGLFDDIVMHELMHVLGFGTLWNYGSHNLVQGFRYTGAEALTAYKDAGHPGATFIPVEADGGSGTAGGHWDEQALGNELMTGWIDNDNYLSKFSVMSLADLGYDVSYQDYPYDVPFIA